MRKLSAITRKPGLALAAFTILILAAVAFADDDSSLKVVPFTFDPHNTDLVAARWVDGAGCPTGATEVLFNSVSPFQLLPPSPLTDPACDPAVGGGDPKDKENAGLLLVKTGHTLNDAAAGARIKGVKGMTLTELGYDLRKPGVGINDPRGSHCGNGAPRFNIVIGTATYFIGCNSPPPTTDTPGMGWQRLRWSSPLMAFSSACPNPNVACPVPGPVDALSILFDEAQDPSGGPDSFGLAVIDNIDINKTLVGRGEGEKEGSEKHKK